MGEKKLMQIEGFTYHAREEILETIYHPWHMIESIWGLSLHPMPLKEELGGGDEPSKEEQNFCSPPVPSLASEGSSNAAKLLTISNTSYAKLLSRCGTYSFPLDNNIW